MTYRPLSGIHPRHAIGTVVWLCFAVMGLLFATANQAVIRIVDFALLVALLILIDGGGSIYKLALWFRYRKEPDKRELIASSTQIFPKKLRQFLMDEAGDREGESPGNESPEGRAKKL